MVILEEAKKLQNELIRFRRDIHSNPELGFNEVETCKYICNILENLNISYKIIGKTGIIATIGSGEKCVALRAELDALPINETTNLPYSSKNKGVMHACGHDMHIAMLLGAAKLLANMQDKLLGKVMFIFQPAEEVLPGGAKMMLEAEIFSECKPDYIFAQHINPAEESGKILVAPAEVMASTNEIFWTIQGKSSHAAQPHLGNDAILAAANIVVFAQNIISKFRNPIIPATLSVCSINGGNTTNIFPNSMKMQGVMRTFDENYRKELELLIVEKSKSVAKLYNCNCEVEIVRGYPAVINDSKAAELVQNSAAKLFGRNFVQQTEPKLLAEDFAYFSQIVPSCFWFIGAKQQEQLEFAGLHNSSLSPDEEILYKGAALMAEVAMLALNEDNK